MLRKIKIVKMIAQNGADQNFRGGGKQYKGSDFDDLQHIKTLFWLLETYVSQCIKLAQCKNQIKTLRNILRRRHLIYL